MKHVLIIIFCLLLVASAGTWIMSPTQQSKLPVISWVTDANPARIEQVATFQYWLKKHHYPPMVLKLDSANRDLSKMIIQGVSGVGGDVMDIGSGPGMRYFNSIGLLYPVNQEARKLGYGLDKTYAAIGPEISMNGKQYTFPCNVAALMYWINLSALEKYGIQPPPVRWDLETFERIGKQFVKAANKPGARREYFFLDRIHWLILLRSFGQSVFNETCTRSTLDSDAFVKVLQLQRKWTEVDHLLPSAAEESSFDTESGYGGAGLYLFNQGKMAMLLFGRYILIRIRKFQEDRVLAHQPLLKLGVSEPPYAFFPNTTASTRAGGVYAGSKHKDLAVYFQAFLASKDYNMQIVHDADALPPNPIYTKTQAYLKPLPMLPDFKVRFFRYEEDETDVVAEFKRRFYEALDALDRGKPWSITQLPRPPKPRHMTDAEYQAELKKFDTWYTLMIDAYKTEWGTHERFSTAINEIGIGSAVSPFIVPTVGAKIILQVMQEYKNHLCDAREAAARAQQQINAEIDRTLKENPQWQVKYDALWKDQQQIDTLRASGKKIPAKLIRNPFYHHYYRAKGRLKEAS